MISVIIVSFPGDAEYLPRCIQSCISHNVKREIVIGYAGFLPDSVRNAMWGLSNVKWFECYPDPGHAVMRNMAVNYASGEYVIMLDSDDWLLPGALDKMLEIANMGADVVSACMETDDGSIAKPPIADTRSYDTLWNLTKITNPIFTTSLIRKSEWVKVGGVDDVKWDDYRLVAKLVKANSTFAHLGVPVYHHTTRPGSASVRYAASEDIARLNAEAIEPLL